MDKNQKIKESVDALVFLTGRDPVTVEKDLRALIAAFGQETMDTLD